MTTMKSGVRAHTGRRLNAITVAGLAGLTMAPLSHAADSATVTTAVGASASSETVNVTGQRTRPESPKYTAPLLDTPQTVTIIDSGTIRGQNLLTLREILSTAPGITFGAGEGGGGVGDSINLRGYAATSDITVDGVRDSASYTRTDSFNLEQIELTNGANSVYSGSGSLGGTINLVSKTPHGSDEATVTGFLGTDDYYRGTLDADYTIADGIVFRLNAMAHRNDVPGRDVERYERWGVAPAITFGLNSDTQLTLSYLHQEDDNIPQYGVPYYDNDYANGLLAGVDRSSYFGYRNLDTQQIDVDQFTARIEHDFNDWLSVRNLTRWQEVSQVSVQSALQGNWCMLNGIVAGTGAACANPGTYAPSGPRGLLRDTTNTLFYNQTDFSAVFNTGSLRHTAVLGFSFSSEDFHLDTGSLLRNADGTLAPVPVISFENPDNVWNGPVNRIITGRSDGQLDTRAIYAFDTIEIDPQWEVNLGVRYEKVEGEFTAAALPATGEPGNLPPWPNGEPTLVQGDVFRSTEELLSYRFGVVFKPVENGSIYFAYGNTETPSQASVNGGCTIATCDVDPEKGEIYELGVKWNLMDDRLLVSASIFQNERTNYKVASNDPALPDQQLDGSSRVRGLTLSATGSITDELSVFANYTYLDSEVLQGVSDFCLANPTVPTCATALAGADGVAGNPLRNTPKHSGSFWFTYELPEGFTVGYGASYQGKYATYNGLIVRYEDDYWLHNAMVSYQATDDLLLQLNIKNLFDEDYLVRVRNNLTNGWALPGDAFSATLSASYTF